MEFDIQITCALAFKPFLLDFYHVRETMNGDKRPLH